MKIDVSKQVVNDDGVPMFRFIADGSGLTPTKEAPMQGVKRVPHTLGDLMREALNGEAFQKGKEQDQKLRIALVCKILRKGGEVDMKKPGWQLVIDAAKACDTPSHYFAQIHEAIFPDQIFSDDSIVEPEARETKLQAVEKARA